MARIKIPRWLKKYWKFQAYLVVIGTIVGTLFIYIAEKTGIFTEEALHQKHCYLYKGNELKAFYGINSINAGYKLVAYHFLDKKPVRFLDRDEDLVKLRKMNREVDVLNYSKDSVFAWIRFEVYLEQRGGMTREINCYVPTFTLHDSPPPCHPDCS